MTDHLTRELRFLRAYVALSTAALIALFVSTCRPTQNGRFDEITVERINVVEPDGTMRLVISNRERSSGPIFRGEPFGYPGGTRPGLIFFNDEGTETGGLTFSGRRSDDGSVSASGHLSFDQYEQDQVVYLQYIDRDGQRRMGLTVADRADVSIMDVVTQMDSINEMPDGPAKDSARQRLMEPRPGEPLMAQRLFAGRDPSRAAIVRLSDPHGRTRLRMVVDSLGDPGLEFLDENGNVTLRLPESRR